MGNPGKESNVGGTPPFDITQGSGPFWQDHGIDHMDDAIAGNDIGLHDLGVVDHDAVTCVNRDRLSLDSLCAVEFDDISGHHFARYNVVGQHGNQLILVLGLEQVVDGPVRERGKGIVQGRVDREGAGARQRFGEAGGLDRRNEGREAFVAGGDVDDGGGLRRRGGRAVTRSPRSLR